MTFVPQAVRFAERSSTQTARLNVFIRESLVLWGIVRRELSRRSGRA
jgi:hypothetical protein